MTTRLYGYQLKLTARLDDGTECDITPALGYVYYDSTLSAALPRLEVDIDRAARLIDAHELARRATLATQASQPTPVSNDTSARTGNGGRLRRVRKYLRKR
jgi:hypothetical protein